MPLKNVLANKDDEIVIGYLDKVRNGDLRGGISLCAERKFRLLLVEFLQYIFGMHCTFEPKPLGLS